MKWWKKCPLLLILAVSGIIFTLISVVNLNGVYREYEGKTFMTPVMAAFFQGAKEGNYPWTAAKEQAGELAKKDGQKQEEEYSESSVSEPGEGTKQEAEELPASELAGQDEEETEGSRSTEDGQEDESIGPKDSEKAETESEISEEASEEIFEESQSVEEELTYDFVRVEEDYFDDALFIGDSRTQGLFEYGGLEERATFYCKTSLTVYDLFKRDKAFIKIDGKNVTLTEALTQRQFGKIYLMVGINELGTGTPESFFEEYAKAVFKIRELQPDAIIFAEGIMRVATKKNASDPIFNNDRINIRNVEIETLADNRSIFYIDVNEAVCDENGNLYDDWTFDQIHLKAKYYEVWKEFLLDHGIVRE